MIKHKIAIPWTCTTRAHLLDEELSNIMKKAGCRSIDIGMESGSDRMLKIIKKDITIDQFYKAESLMRKYSLIRLRYYSGNPQTLMRKIKHIFVI